jgi:hypothetical protein
MLIEIVPAHTGQFSSKKSLATTRDTTLSRLGSEPQLSRFHILSNQLILAQEANLFGLERLDGFLGSAYRFEHAA